MGVRFCTFIKWEGLDGTRLGNLGSKFQFYSEKISIFYRSPLNILFILQILSQGINAQTEALKYARTHFAKFVNIFQKDIQILMGALMYLPVGIENSPYRTLIAPEMWIEVRNITKHSSIIVANNLYLRPQIHS